MNLEFLEIGFDILISVLLVATIVYAVILNRKLDALRSAKTEMEVLIRSFAETTLKAERSISELKMHAAEAGSGLQAQIKQSEALLTDMRLLTEKGETVCERLQSSLSESPAEARVSAGGARRSSGNSTAGSSSFSVRDPDMTSEDRSQDTRKKPDQPRKAGKGEKVSPAAADLLKALKGMR
ncbi:DUF6468 domain-containing protein [Kiloniella sp. b19]|uniref:DUF6468 domain-containing protein n=1 Tax=Kiloniella sp. GXU_MW_B19 TaxID=3141326 RepID=UPI0031CDD8A5